MKGKPLGLIYFIFSSLTLIHNFRLKINYLKRFRFSSRWNVQIQAITADSASPQRTVVEVLVVNSGLAPGLFRPWLVECSGELPPDAVPEGPAVLIPPLHRHLFQILMEGALPAATMTCTGND